MLKSSNYTVRTFWDASCNSLSLTNSEFPDLEAIFGNGILFCSPLLVCVCNADCKGMLLDCCVLRPPCICRFNEPFCIKSPCPVELDKPVPFITPLLGLLRLSVVAVGKSFLTNDIGFCKLVFGGRVLCVEIFASTPRTSSKSLLMRWEVTVGE